MSDVHISPETTPLLERLRDFVAAERECWINRGTGKIDHIELTSAGKLVQEAIKAIDDGNAQAPRLVVDATPSSEAVRSLVWLVEHGTNDDLVAARGCILERLRGHAKIPPRQSYDVAFHENQIDKLDALKAVERGEFTDLPPLADSRRGPAQSPTVDDLTSFLCDTQDRLGPGCDERAIAQALLSAYSVSSTHSEDIDAKTGTADDQGLCASIFGSADHDH